MSYQIASGKVHRINQICEKVWNLGIALISFPMFLFAFVLYALSLLLFSVLHAGTWVVEHVVFLWSLAFGKGDEER